MNKNPISKLQEICQQWKIPVPTYGEGEGGFAHFGTELVIRIEDDMVQFSATGRTKKESKANVAQEALNFIEEHYPKYLEPPILTVSRNVSRTHVHR